MRGSITYSQCVFVASVLQPAKRMRSIILSNVAGLVLSYFSTLYYTKHDFRKKKYITEHKMCLLIFSKIFV